MFVAEVVEIFAGGLLRGGDSQLHSCAAREGGLLAPGFYLALRPTHSTEVCYDENVRYHGPFEQREIADRLKRSVLYLSPLLPGGASRGRQLVQVVDTAHLRAAADPIPAALSAEAANQ